MVSAVTLSISTVQDYGLRLKLMATVIALNQLVLMTLNVMRLWHQPVS